MKKLDKLETALNKVIEIIFIMALLLLIAFAVWGFHANIKLYKDNPNIHKIKLIKKELEDLESFLPQEERIEVLREYRELLSERLRE